MSLAVTLAAISLLVGVACAGGWGRSSRAAGRQSPPARAGHAGATDRHAGPRLRLGRGGPLFTLRVNTGTLTLRRGDEYTVVGVVGKVKDYTRLEALKAAPGVEDVIRITHPYKLVSSGGRDTRTKVRVGDVCIGGDEVVVIAGPCSIESREQMMKTARAVRAAGASMLRGGAYKPRTSPYDFQGLGVEAPMFLREAGDETGLPVVTEVMSTDDVEIVSEYADMLQIGARNMQNFSLLRRMARCNRPVLLKRGPSATVKEWLLAAEYLLAGGNSQVVLCERGIKTFETDTRNTLDLAAVALAKELSHLPVIADPSHATGKRSLVPILSHAAVAVAA